jgi:3-methyladenine DNA glycosylase/8-oxoguanine DNA glycosylase
MVDRLVEELGEQLPGQNGRRAFPPAAAVAAAGPEFLKQSAGLGYRSGYVWELAASLVEGRLDLLAFEDPELPTAELYRKLRQIKGVGDYAAATILMLLGRYEHLAIDSEMRAFVSKKYLKGQPAGDSQIRAIYAPWGNWQYLAYWFDAPV